MFDTKIRLMENNKISDVMICYIMSEEALAKNWDTPEEDEAWNYVPDKYVVRDNKN